MGATRESGKDSTENERHSRERKETSPVGRDLAAEGFLKAKSFGGKLEAGKPLVWKLGSFGGGRARKARDIDWRIQGRGLEEKKLGSEGGKNKQKREM